MAPRVWILAARRAGDNNPLFALANALGWPYETKRFVYRPTELASNLTFDATLLGRSTARSSRVGPPWPDLVISGDRPGEPIARWIRQRATRRVKLVHVGRPWRDVDRFDLVVVTPEYRVPAGERVVQNPLPMHELTRARLETAAGAWRSRLALLPRPRIALLVGGNSELFTFDVAAAVRLARAVSAMARSAHGSLLVTTSARTPIASANTLFSSIDVPSENYRWHGHGARDNPYLAFLALADEIVVTGDSIPMLADACATGRPVHIFDPGRYAGGGSADFVAALRRRFRHLGVARLGRDLRRVHNELLAHGSAVILGDRLQKPPAAVRDYVGQTAARVRRLVAAEVSPIRANLRPQARST